MVHTIQKNIDHDNFLQQALTLENLKVNENKQEVPL